MFFKRLRPLSLPSLLLCLGKKHLNNLSSINSHFTLLRGNAASYSTMNISLSNIRPAAGSRKPRKRVGRGLAAGGRTCGRGNSGQKSRSGPGIPRGFEGGQTPLHFRIPKRAKVHPSKRRPLTLLALDRLQHLIDIGRLDTTKPITMYHLREAGVSGIKWGVRVTGSGASYFVTKGLILQVSSICQKAIRRIEKLNGIAAAVYHNDRGLMHLLRPSSTKVHTSLSQPKFLPPMTPKLRQQYSRLSLRGYLHPIVRERLLAVDPTFEQRYIMVEPFKLIKKPNFPLNVIPKILRREGVLPA